MKIDVLGSEYGAWPVRVDLLSAESIIYSVGVGLDITWEEEVIRIVGCKAYGFDPTPEVVPWAKEKEDAIAGFYYLNVAVGEHEGEMRFYHHKEKAFTTHSLIPGGSWENIPACLVKVITLDQCMQFYGHKQVDYLKLNSGGGYEINLVRSMLKTSIRPRQVAIIEMHLEKTDVAWIRKMMANEGYELVYSDKNQRVLFVRRLDAA